MQTTPEKNDYRGQFRTAADGTYVLKSVRPRGYYIPMDGPVGDMIKAQQRHGMRPAHIHFLIGAVGYRELVTALYLAGDPHLADDVVFGASGDLIAHVRDVDPECPIKGLPSVRFDFTVSRETEADRKGGRVGADPAAMLAGAAGS
jgi:protocatechuate 3,4-dioxygenase beta subunit